MCLEIYSVCRYRILGMQIWTFSKTSHIQKQFLERDPVFKYEFLVLFIYPCMRRINNLRYFQFTGCVNFHRAAIVFEALFTNNMFFTCMASANGSNDNALVVFHLPLNTSIRIHIHEMSKLLTGFPYGGKLIFKS